MKKYRKKIALILVLALALVATIPALAGQTTKITGKYEPPAIEVVIPTAAQAVINPFALPVSIKANDGSEAFTIEDAQIVTRPLIGYNMSDIDLKIGASVSAETKGGFKLATAAPKDTDTTKSGLVYFEVKASEAAAGYSNAPDTTPTADFIGNLKTDEVKTAITGWDATEYNKDSTQQILVGRTAVSKSGMCEVAAAETDATTGAVTPAATGYFMGRLSGKVVKLPKEEWVTADGLTATITWIIEPA